MRGMGTPGWVTRPVEDLVADDFLLVLLSARGGRLRLRDEVFLPVELAALVTSERTLRAAFGEPAGTDPLRPLGFQADGPGAYRCEPVDPTWMLERALTRGRLVRSRDWVPPFRHRTLPAEDALDALRADTARGIAEGPKRAPRAHLLARAASRWSVVDALAGPDRAARRAVERAAAEDPPEVVIPLIRAAWDQMREVRRESVMSAPDGP